MREPDINPFAPPAERWDQTERRLMTPTLMFLLVILGLVLVVIGTAFAIFVIIWSLLTLED